MKCGKHPDACIDFIDRVDYHLTDSQSQHSLPLPNFRDPRTIQMSELMKWSAQMDCWRLSGPPKITRSENHVGMGQKSSNWMKEILRAKANIWAKSRSLRIFSAQVRKFKAINPVRGLGTSHKWLQF